MAKITFKNIQTLAKDVKKYVEKNKKLPKSLTVAKVTYTYPQIGYILSKSIVNIGKDITVMDVKVAPKPSGETVKLDLDKSEYIKESKDYYKFIEEKKRIPNYSKIKGKKVKQRVMIYSLAKIIVWYTNNGKKLPNTCRFYTSETISKKTTTTTRSSSKSTKTTSSSNGLHDYLTSKGCSGMGQCTGYFCACNSLQQSFYRLTGIKVDEKTIAGWAGTTSSGTDHNGINTAVAKFNKKYNKKVKITWYNFSDLGGSSSARWKKIAELIKKGAVFFHLSYRNKWGHYEVIKTVGDDLKILNSLGDSCGSGTYCGYIETRTRSTQQSYISGISQKSVAVLTNG